MFSASFKNFYLTQRQKQAWLAIVGLVLFLAIFLLLGAGRFLIFAFPATTLVVGIFLYLRTPALYVGFTFWVFFLGPLIRRMIDYQSGYITPGPLEFTSLLVASISCVTLVRQLPKMHRQEGLPFILCLGSVVYGVLIGLILNPINNYLMLTLPLIWLCPILFGFHLFVNWRNYPSYRQTIERTFLWGMLIMGIYGIWQFLVAPEWDRFWLITTDISSRGSPEPLGIRVWSTMNSPQEFATVTMASLLLLLCNPKNPLFIPIAAIGSLVFLLTKTRGPWISFLVGLIVFIPYLRSSFQIRLVISIIAAAIFAVPLIFIEPFYTGFSSRFETLFQLTSDYSLNARIEGYNALLNQALAELFGKGFGFQIDTSGTSFGANDGAIIPMLLNLGWFGTVPYLGGVFILLFNLFQAKENRSDPFISAVRAITLAIITRVWLYLIFTGVVSIVFWGFLGIGLAGCKYYYHQRTAVNQSLLQNSP